MEWLGEPWRPTYREPRAASLWPVTRTLWGLLARSSAVVTVSVAVPLTYAAAASADVPERWDVPDDVSFMHTLLVLVLVPLACMVVLALAVYVPAIVRGESVAPAGARAEDQWFGGRADKELALESRKADAAGSADQTGGASGSW